MFPTKSLQTKSSLIVLHALKQSLGGWNADKINLNIVSPQDSMGFRTNFARSFKLSFPDSLSNPRAWLRLQRLPKQVDFRLPASSCWFLSFGLSLSLTLSGFVAFRTSGLLGASLSRPSFFVKVSPAACGIQLLLWDLQSLRLLVFWSL